MIDEYNLAGVISLTRQPFGWRRTKVGHAKRFGGRANDTNNTTAVPVNLLRGESVAKLGLNADWICHTRLCFSFKCSRLNLKRLISNLATRVEFGACVASNESAVRSVAFHFHLHFACCNFHL